MKIDDTITKLPKETVEYLCSILEGQIETSFKAVVETDKWLTQHNFLVNAGGAGAILGYLSSTPTPTYAIAPLIIFLVGVIASGIEIRYSLKTHYELHKDAMRRRGGFVSDELSVAQAADVQAPLEFTKNVNHYSGIVAQASFLIGCIAGIWGFIAL